MRTGAMNHEVRAEAQCGDGKQRNTSKEQRGVQGGVGVKAVKMVSRLEISIDVLMIVIIEVP